MGVLNILAAIAEIILALELVVVALLVAALCTGLWFGLRFVEKKVDPVFGRVNGYITKARDIEHLGFRYAVTPFVMANALGEQIGVTVTTLVDRAREGKGAAGPSSTRVDLD